MAVHDPDTDRQVPEDPMLAQTPGVEAQGRGPADGRQPSRREYHHAAAGWGATRSVGKVVWRAREPVDGRASRPEDEPRGQGLRLPRLRVARRPKGLHLDICENGIKHVTWEMTRKQVGAEFFAAPHRHRARALERLRARGSGPPDEPMTYDPERDTYVPISWDDAFALVGETLRGLDSPDEACLLHVRPAQQRGDVPLPAVGARARHEQPAGLLEHVPRGERPGADRVARHRQGNVRPRRLGSGRR